MFTRKIFNISNLVLIVALTLSVIAAWYSILGLVAIFAAAVIPIIIMGSALEVAKVVTTIWLHRYWDKITWLYKLYLVPAVIILAFITSMGIFGFLSKAHTDQNLVSGDVQSKIAIYDEKIKIAKENIDANRAALKQLDAAVDQIMGRSTTESGAERSVQIRRQQGPERQRLIREIEAEQKKISALNEERAPIAAEVRKVEAEVGPIKYIAALIYGDNPDANLLERAVRWVIILLVLVFDPLALVLVVASNTSRKWEIFEIFNKKPIDEPNDLDKVEETVQDTIEELIQETPKEEPKEEPKVEQTYLKRPWVYKVPGVNVGHQVFRPEVKPEVVIEPEVINCSSCNQPLEKIPSLGLFCVNTSCNLGNFKLDIVEEIQQPVIEPTKEITVDTIEIQTTGVTRERPYKEVDGGYVVYDNKSMKKDAFQALHPEFFKLTKDSMSQINTSFGSEFPKVANKGDVFVRVDVLPNRVFKFDSVKWIEINKESSDSYLHDVAYIEYLVKKLEKGEYDVDLLSDNEKAQIEKYLSNQKH